MTLSFPIYAFVSSVCFVCAACPSSSSKSAGDGGAGAEARDADTAGSGASGTAGSAGTGGSSSGIAAGAATVVVKTAVSPLMVQSYDLTTGKFAGQRNNDEFYANFSAAAKFGSMYGGDVIGLRFSGFFKTGTFACGDRAKPNDDYAVQTAVDFSTFVNSASDSKMYKGLNAGSTCKITVTKLDATTIEGTYTAKLYSDATTFVEISGAFHAEP